MYSYVAKGAKPLEERQDRHTIVFYHYYEKDQTYIDNLKFFLDFGYEDSADYVIIIAGVCSIELPIRPNIKCLHTKNVRFDFGGYSEAINTAVDLNRYDYFVFVNSSVRGPFLPGYLEDSWTSIFTRVLSDDIKLVGSTINILHTTTGSSKAFAREFNRPGPFTHVQSTAYAMDKMAIEYLIKEGFYSQNFRDEKTATVVNYEILLSQKLIWNGWNIACLLAEFRQLDFRTITRDINTTSDGGDPCYANAYFGRTLHPYECIFVKTNRNMIDNKMLASITESRYLSRPGI